MKKLNLLWLAILVIGLLAGGTPAVAGQRVLLLVDAETEGTVSLVEALVKGGHEVVEFFPEHMWNGNNPSLAGFDVVVHLNGAGFLDPFPASAQIALAEFVRNGGGYVGAQFNGYEADVGQMDGMLDLVLQLWDGPDFCYGCTMDWTVVPGAQGHTVLAGVPEAFSFSADAHDAVPLVEFEDDPSTALMTSPAGEPAVIVREFECGRVVSFSIAPNASSWLTLQDPIIKQLYLNAVAWSGSSECVPASFDGLLTEIRNLVKARKLAWWRGVFLGLTVRTAEFYYDRGHTEIAVNFLWGFTFKVERMIRRGQLAEEDGGPLADAARRLIEEISGP